VEIKGRSRFRFSQDLSAKGESRFGFHITRRSFHSGPKTECSWFRFRLCCPRLGSAGVAENSSSSGSSVRSFACERIGWQCRKGKREMPDRALFGVRSER